MRASHFYLFSSYGISIIDDDMVEEILDHCWDLLSEEQQKDLTHKRFKQEDPSYDPVTLLVCLAEYLNLDYEHSVHGEDWDELGNYNYSMGFLGLKCIDPSKGKREKEIDISKIIT
ncbi:MAG: hypothetical protein WD512_15350 [Candidatus Paceibacterota bacterium]